MALLQGQIPFQLKATVFTSDWSHGMAGAYVIIIIN